MNTTQLLTFYFERSTALQNYWTLYVVVIGSLLAFSSIRKQPDRITTALVSILFIFFAYKNLGAIEDVSAQRLALLDGFKQLASAAGPALAAIEARTLTQIEPTLVSPHAHDVRHFHIITDVLVIVALWAMELRRKRAAIAGQHA